MTTEKFTKLPELAKPTLYSVHLKLDVEKFVCHGHETIDIEVGLKLKSCFLCSALDPRGDRCGCAQLA